MFGSPAALGGRGPRSRPGTKSRLSWPGSRLPTFKERLLCESLPNGDPSEEPITRVEQAAASADWLQGNGGTELTEPPSALGSVGRYRKRGQKQRPAPTSTGRPFHGPEKPVPGARRGEAASPLTCTASRAQVVGRGCALTQTPGDT